MCVHKGFSWANLNRGGPVDKRTRWGWYIWYFTYISLRCVSLSIPPCLITEDRLASRCLSKQRTLGLGPAHRKWVDSQSTCIYRVQSSVWRLPNYRPPTPSPPSECVLPPHQRQGDTQSQSPGGERVGVNISEDARLWICLLQYNPSTGRLETYRRRGLGAETFQTNTFCLDFYECYLSMVSFKRCWVYRKGRLFSTGNPVSTHTVLSTIQATQDGRAPI